jgi:hypothetical protein
MGNCKKHILLPLDGNFDACYRHQMRDEMGDLDMKTKIAHLVDLDFPLHSKLWH